MQCQCQCRLSVHCTIFENRKTTRNLSTHTHTHRRSLYTIAFTFATSKSPIYPHMSCTIPKPWLIINRGFCFVSFCFLFFFFFGRGKSFFVVWDCLYFWFALGAPPKTAAYSNRLFRCMHMYDNGRKLPFSGHAKFTCPNGTPTIQIDDSYIILLVWPFWILEFYWNSTRVTIMGL